MRQNGASPSIGARFRPGARFHRSWWQRRKRAIGGGCDDAGPSEIGSGADPIVSAGRVRRPTTRGEAVRTVSIPGTDIVTSCIGMGCASLGSRISPSQGRRMLEAAHRRGVTWFDVAPSYGAGRAETILAPFLAAHRDEVFVCSKVGLAPPARNGLMRLVYDLGRPVIGVARGLRRRFRSLAATRNQRIPLTPELIETSITASLARLGIERLDVYALHDPDPADLGRDEILRALERVRARGQTRHLSVAGTLEAVTRAAGEPLFSFYQLADDPMIRPLPELRRRIGRPVGLITHSVLGVGGAADRLVARLRADPRLVAELGAAGYAGPPDSVAARLLMRRAFASNPDGVVLASMFSDDHLAADVEAAALPIDPLVLGLVERAHGVLP
jgi:aryl-alcohol dehydrogenase-like predicted oxidoreductase